MQISVILAHPDPGSFNHAIVAAVMETLEANRHAIFFHYLYEEKFDPLLYRKEIAAVDGIIIAHPNW
jgi:NAD(P)H dehydrogenase (quinone)